MIPDDLNKLLCAVRSAILIILDAIEDVLDVRPRNRELRQKKSDLLDL